ncbi:mucin-13 [Loxodonta africana]|uniref:mucin-13 n=1 Tax=Loxodonta africana TaxID=9785 RepID=UPI0030CC07AB
MAVACVSQGFSFPFAVPHNGPAGKDSSSYPGPTSNFASLDDIQYIEEGNINMFLLPGNPWTVSSAAHGGHYPNLLWEGSPEEFQEQQKEQDLCEYRGCKKNAGDDCSDGLQCECKDDLERPNLQVPFCLALASNCPDNCNEKNHKQCLQKDDGGVPECVCLPGYQDKEGTCEMCPFGYSGVDCKDQFQLILTIVGSVAGILILSMVIALVVLSRSRNKPKNIEEQNLIEDSFSSLKLQETGFTNSGADGHIFPKIKIAPSRDQPQNPYVNQRGMLPLALWSNPCEQH